ncbi:hypothetical protein [Parabacteroides distasonis]|uniref:Uncharacterized protein n=1 Tax=Parabacteroides distasonis TaxID=823 RepID=A0A174WWP3_PARDI|nr:hypothetical protein [Parabacteroides distasonis]MRY83502.1 hypothetical protein [Parabacteroides distasonis]MRZ05878.1 hypothetical protein [Parabacteroides distasonis]CUQ51714.1 Uncharacterised protein [Parabacteroides distasonis]
MKRYSVNIKEIEIKIHQGNYRRRVKYDNKDFDLLVISIEDETEKRYFALSASILPDKDSIHINYDPISKNIQWSPLLNEIIEVTKFYK